MMRNYKFNQLTFGFCILAISTVASAAPISIITDSEYMFRETRYNAPAYFAQGDNFLIGASVDIAAGSTMTAYNSFTLETFNLIDEGGGEYFSFIEYSEDRAKGDWAFAALNGTDTAVVSLGALGIGPGTGQLPALLDLTVSGPLTSPTLSWELPAGLDTANGGNVDRLRTRIRADDGSTIFDSRSDLGQNLGLNLTSYDILGGYITAPGTYHAQVMIEGYDPFIRSATFASFTVPVPEPSITALFVVGLVGLGFAKLRKA